MRSRGKSKPLAKVVAIRAAQLAEARHVLMLANEAEQTARDAARDAHLRTEMAVSEWQNHLGSAFEPEFARALAGQLVERVELAAGANDHAARAVEEQRERQRGWHISDAHLRQVQEVLSERRRAETRHRDERELDAMADRVTYGWMRP